MEGEGHIKDWLVQTGKDIGKVAGALTQQEYAADPLWGFRSGGNTTLSDTLCKLKRHVTSTMKRKKCPPLRVCQRILLLLEDLPHAGIDPYTCLRHRECARDSLQQCCKDLELLREALWDKSLLYSLKPPSKRARTE